MSAPKSQSARRWRCSSTARQCGTCRFKPPANSSASIGAERWSARLIGSALLTRVQAPRLLAVFTVAACGLCLFVFTAGGIPGGYAALSIGLFNSIMFPVIFTITLERSTASEEATSGFLCFSIVGGAAIPPITGLVSQHTSYVTAFIVPATCYAVLSLFAIASGRAATHLRDEPAVATIH